MNEVIENMTSRRSVRAYSSKPVDRALIDEIIEAGLYAPSAMNRQDTLIIAIEDKSVRDKISKMNAAIMGSNSDPFYGAPVILLVLYNKANRNGIYDGSLVLGNMMNAAHSLGLSSCWIHRAKEEFESDFGKKILADLGIEEEYEGIGHCALGYAAEPAKAAAARKENYVYYVR